MAKAAAPLQHRRFRCAVYTRKSSEEGLEQEFNSLHAQREACEAYIRSQRHEGWVCLPQAYDDGGFSGGTLDRPALQRLLTDIGEGKIDVVVTYKIDRLTRSLRDFAKITEIFEARGVSFVSVTQQFNTTTSMGRLTLNVLLSFAQFEREVAGERIRDKIAASKKKGWWMGGMPPLGYRVQDRKLVVIPGEAETVRHIFRRYVALGSVRLLQQELETQGITSKSWTSSSGRHWGGKPIARGALYLLLQNRIYRGEIVHKDQHYPGEHQAIIDPQLWEAAQAKLAANAVERSTGIGARSPSLLAGLLFDADGNRMTPTHALKNDRRYRYYVSQPLITGARVGSPNGMRVPAPEIEQLVTDRIQQLFGDPASLIEASEPFRLDAAAQRDVLERAAELAATWSTFQPSQIRVLLTTLVRRIEFRSGRIELHSSPLRILGALGLPNPPRADDRGTEPDLILCVPSQLRRAGKEITLRIDPREASPASPNPSLIKLVVRAHLFHSKLLNGSPGKYNQLAKREKLNRAYFTRVLRLAYLAPDITRAILEGRQPRGLTFAKLIQDADLPIAWSEQREALGFDQQSGHLGK
jgi:site-specific DNA recombinase